MDARPVHKHSMHQPHKPHNKKSFMKHFFIQIVSAILSAIYLYQKSLWRLVMEIERKYAIKKLPIDLDKCSFKVIEQGYLCHNPTVRIRKMDDEYILTYKSKADQTGVKKAGGARISNEVELPLTKDAYMHLRNKADGRLIYKKRYYIPLGDGLTAELDIFDGHLKGFVMVEVEFPSEEAADTFTAPEWFGKELTGDKRFSNYNLSKLSSPDELAL